MPYVIGFLLLLVIWVLISVYDFFESIGWGWLALIVATIIGIAIWISSWRAKNEAAERESRMAELTAELESQRAELMNKYHDEEIVERIMDGDCWLGQTEDQLREAMGSPDDTDTKSTTRMTREVWKYDETGANRYALKITLTDGMVTAIDDKR